MYLMKLRTVHEIPKTRFVLYVTSHWWEYLID